MSKKSCRKSLTASWPDNCLQDGPQKASRVRYVYGDEVEVVMASAYSELREELTKANDRSRNEESERANKNAEMVNKTLVQMPEPGVEIEENQNRDLDLLAELIEDEFTRLAANRRVNGRTDAARLLDGAAKQVVRDCLRTIKEAENE